MIRALLLAVVLCAVASTAAAQMDALGPCNPDAQKLCADVEAGHGAKMKCLSAHEAELSPECKERITAVKAKVGELAKEIEEACGQDGKKLCADHALGAGLLPCLSEHEKDLSPICRDWLATHGRKPGAAP
jgi:hypothetical protein